MTKYMSLKRESLVATLLTAALILIFAYPIIQLFISLGDVVLNRSAASQAALVASRAGEDRVSLKDHLEGLRNWRMLIGIVLAAFTFISIWFMNGWFRGYDVTRKTTSRTFFGTVGMIFSIYAVSFLINAIALLIHVSAICYAYSTVNNLHCVIAWIVGIGSAGFYIVMLFVSGNQLLDESDRSLCTGLGIGESIYDYWVELQFYRTKIDEKQNLISSYVSKTQYL